MRGASGVGRAVHNTCQLSGFAPSAAFRRGRKAPSASAGSLSYMEPDTAATLVLQHSHKVSPQQQHLPAPDQRHPCAVRSTQISVRIVVAATRRVNRSFQPPGGGLPRAPTGVRVTIRGTSGLPDVAAVLDVSGACPHDTGSTALCHTPQCVAPCESDPSATHMGRVSALDHVGRDAGATPSWCADVLH
jgi:hypothetical protein